MEGRGEVCFEEVVGRLWSSGMSAGEIGREMGVDPVWVESLISTWEGDHPARQDTGPDDHA